MLCVLCCAGDPTFPYSKITPVYNPVQLATYVQV